MDTKTRDKEYPHQVEIAVPPSGLGSQMDAMAKFSARWDYQTWIDIRGILPREQYFSIWCFTDPEHAEEFASKFGGTRVTKDSGAE